MSDIASGVAVASIGGATHDGERFHAAQHGWKTDTAARGTARGSASALEPSDLAVRRSARRLSILGSRASASRLPGSARPTDGGTRLAGGNARAFLSAELPRVSETSETCTHPARQLGAFLHLVACAALIAVLGYLLLFAWEAV